MADDSPVVFGMSDAVRIGRAVSEYERTAMILPNPRKRQQFPGGDGGEALIGRLITAISPASNSLTGATEFKVALWVPDPDIDPQTVPKTLMEEVDEDFVLIETDCVNRSKKLSANPGGMVILNRINGELIPEWVEDSCAD